MAEILLRFAVRLLVPRKQKRGLGIVNADTCGTNLKHPPLSLEVYFHEEIGIEKIPEKGRTQATDNRTQSLVRRLRRNQKIRICSQCYE